MAQKTIKLKLQTGNYAVIDESDYELVSRYKWYEDHGYARTSSNGKKIYMHRLVMGSPSSQVDHINRDRLDNRKANLRVCSDLQNKWNLPKQKRNKSGYKGVTRHSNLWRATIVVNGKQKSLGYHKEKLDAARAYDKAALEYFGEYAAINGVDYAA